MPTAPRRNYGLTKAEANRRIEAGKAPPLRHGRPRHPFVMDAEVRKWEAAIPQRS